MTMPPKVAGQFISLNLKTDQISSRLETQYSVGVNNDVDQNKIALQTLWEIDESLVQCVDELANENVETFTPDDLIGFFEEHGCGDVLVRWTDEQVKRSFEEGKIPTLSNWKHELESGEIGLDSLMNLAGLNHFRSDQQATDKRVQEVMEQSGSYV